MLSRLRRALIPKDPLYRRESGAGRRVVLAAKAAGVMAVLGAYLFWMVGALAGEDVGQLPVAITAVASYFFGLLAFVLGLQSVRNEITDGTAETLVMTPLSRGKIVISKLAGSSEFIVIAALLLPLYCYTLLSGYGGIGVRAHLHGGFFRCWLMLEDRVTYWFDNEQSFLVDAVVGFWAFAGDLAWYLLLAACGAWAAVSRRSALAVWSKGLLTAGCVLVALTFTEWVGIDCEEVTKVFGALLQADSLRDVTRTAADYNLLSRWHHEGLSGSWTAVWVAFSIGLRLMFAWFFLRRAARNFDRIATD